MQTASRSVGNADAAQVALPDHLSWAQRHEGLAVRYSLDVSTCADAPGSALWLYRVGAPYRVSTDGQALPLLNPRALLDITPEDDGPWVLADVHNGRIPALFALPPGARSVQVELLTLPYFPAGIARAEAGPAATLLGTQARSAERAVAPVEAASVVLLVLGALALALWGARRAERSLLWLGLTCLLWGLRGLAYFGHKVYGAALFFEQGNSWSLLLAAAALSMALLHLLQGGLLRWERRALPALVAASLAAFALAQLLGDGARLARASGLLASFAMVLWVSVRTWRAPARGVPGHRLALLAALLLLVAAGLHDLLLLAGTLEATRPSLIFWGFVLLLMVMAATSAHHVVVTLGRAEQSNEELERAIAAKTAQLEASYALLRGTERESARAQEREHLLREMHDGIGAQLMTALRGVERQALSPAQVQAALQDSLDDLRLLMDSADIGRTLQGALAAWRNRWDPRLAALGIALEWDVGSELDNAGLGPDAVLQVMRILQEATANVVKHAGATHMRLQVWSEPGALCLQVQDNGAGLQPQAPRSAGRGLRNMQNRARLLGGTLQVTSLAPPEHGTRVDLRLPAAN